MKIKFLPTTKPGRLAGYGLLTFVLAFGLMNILIMSGQRGGETFF
ncbi:MAG: hypothetical protein ABH846_04940 [Patescibacteria group bacterium]